MSRDIFHLLASGDTPLYLAPQAGVSESPFRRLCRRFGADVVESEFVSADGIVRGSERAHDYLYFDEAERPIGVQIFGSEPEMMAHAAAMVEATYRPDFVDINFGCPVKKIVKRNGGSGCLRDLDLVGRIVRAVDDATALPTTAKIRSGFDENSREPVKIGKICQDAGARWVTLHPRTRADMYGGEARWTEIEALVKALEIPVIGNGDVRSGEDAVRMKESTGCHGIMIARGCHGYPWIFREARAALDGEPIPEAPGPEARFRVCLEHAQNSVTFGGDEERAVLEFRKHLGWYTKGLPHGRALRQELFQVTSLGEIKERLRDYLEAQLAQAA